MLLSRFTELSEKYKVRVTCVSGDVHTATVSAMLVPGQTKVCKGSGSIYNLTSSPVGNLPAPAKIMAVFFSDIDDVPYVQSDKQCSCKMLDWRSDEKGKENENSLEQRNWLELRKNPSQEGEDKDSLIALLHVENSYTKDDFSILHRVVPSF
jgi:hypothetical protein